MKRVLNGGTIYLASEPERAKGQNCYSGSEEKPDEVHDAYNLMASGAKLATKKAARNMDRGGGGNDGLKVDADFYQRDLL